MRGQPGDLFPADEPRATKSNAERRVWRALKAQLPSGWRAWHSLRLRISNAWEGEGDFVIAAPERGLLVLEVKGGIMSLRGGHWYQYEKRLDRAPREQAQSFVRRLADALKARGAMVPPYGVACVFPETEFSEGPTTGDLEGLVVGERQLGYLAEVLPSLMERAVPDFRMPADSGWLRTLHELWGETWVPSVRLDARASDAETRCVGLDAEQLRLLDFAGQCERAYVEGSAGSGKTIVARELCRRRSEAGQRVQFFCFTDALAKAVQRQFVATGSSERVQASPIRRYAAALVRGEGGRAQTEDPDFWATVSLEAAATALPPEDERPELVVVDEAQDLEESDWALVEELSAGRGLWIFADPHQTFWSERRVPESLTSGMAKLQLVRQYRNTAPVWRLAAGYVDGAGASGELADGPPVRVVVAPPGKLESKIAHELSELRRSGAEPEDIAVLTLAGQTLSELWGKERIGSHRVVRADDDEAPRQMVFDTFLRFKGLERPYVILTELAAGGGSRYKTRMHIAATRATVGLTIVCSEAAAAKDEILAELLKG